MHSVTEQNEASVSGNKLIAIILWHLNYIICYNMQAHFHLIYILQNIYSANIDVTKQLSGLMEHCERYSNSRY